MESSKTLQKEALTISSQDNMRVNQLPNDVIKQINKDIHDYIESVCRDHEKREKPDGSR